MPGPLSPYRIIELTTTVSGPMATMMLADQGADVIKVEPPFIGDTARYLGPQRNGMAGMFAILNRNKRSVALDLKSADDKSILLRLAETADVLLENYRPGVMDRLGLGYEALSERNPRLIYTSISGYGADGPYQNRRVYDPLIQATIGAAHAQGGEQAELLRTIVFDKVTSLTAAQAVTAALLERERTGTGRYLPITMVESALNYFWPDVMWSHTFLGDGASEVGELADYFPMFRAKDGFVQVILVGDDAFELLCVWRGQTHHLDPRFRDLAGRLANAEAFREAVDAMLADVTVDEVCETLDAMGVPVARVNDLGEVHEDEQVKHMGALVEVEHEVAGAMRMPRPPVSFAAKADASFLRRDAPTIGRDTREVLGELGIDEATIEDLEARDRAGAERLAAVLAATTQPSSS